MKTFSCDPTFVTPTLNCHTPLNPEPLALNQEDMPTGLYAMAIWQSFGFRNTWLDGGPSVVGAHDPEPYTLTLGLGFRVISLGGGLDSWSILSTNQKVLSP